MFESRVDTTQHGFQRNARILPGFHEYPVDGGEQQDSSEAALKVLLDFGEVVEIIESIFHGGLAGSARG